jgi:RHS repeat-associated protein
LLAYHYYDASGHCTLLTDGQGNIKEQYYYDAFGLPRFYDAAGTYIGYSQHGNRFLFTGREWLSDLHLYDYRNRLYQPELGRFLQPDPKEFAAGDYNLYRYCHNDPVNNTDPMGLFTPGQPEEVGELFDDKGRGLFGRTTYAATIGVGTGTDANGKFYLQVTQYDVRVVKQEIATIADGQPRSRPAIDATKFQHEPRHDEHAAAFEKRMQKQVVAKGLSKRPTEAMKQRELTRLGDRLTSFNKREQDDCKKGQGEWKSITDKEKTR